MAEFLNHVDGEDQPAADGATLDIEDPSTGEVYATAPLSGPEDVDRACTAAARASQTWRRTTPAERQRALLRLADAMEEHATAFTDAEARDTGKPRAAFRDDELGPIVDTVRFFAGAARLLPGSAAGEYATGHTSMLRREPIGVVAQITPWNYPLMMAAWKIAPAIAAGNTVVLKPADTTPATTVLLARLAAGILPPGVLNVVCGDRDTGRALVAHPVPRMVAVTGSVRAGREIAAAAGAGLKRTHLELGGNAPVIVHADVDIEATATALAPIAYYNAGQDCTAPSRFLVHAKVYEDFVAALAQATADLAPGGPVNNAQQLAGLRSAVASLPAHAKIVCGGTVLPRAGYFHAPTIVAGVRQCDDIVAAETFGPIVTVQPFGTEAEALALAGGVDHGLAASVWTRDHGRAMRAMTELETGIVWVNTHGTTVSEMPHGGVKHSGHGSDLSLQGLLEYTRIKHAMTATRGAGDR